MHTTLLPKPARNMLLALVAALLGAAMGAALMLVVAPPPARAQGTIYVDADATGPTHDGLSWTTAYTTVQDALVTAASGDEIWVAAGVYYPDQGMGQDNIPTSTFTLTTGVALYGGFDPSVEADEWSERDWETYLTVLSGDLEQNDVTDAHGVVTDTAHITGTNAYHVVSGSATDDTTVLDGFTISGGYAHYSLNHSDPHNSGGGMYNDGGHPTLRNITFSGNSAHSYGGGIENVNHSNPILSHVIFQANTAGSGGGMDNYHSDPTLTHVTFSANTATSGGGGMYNSESSPTLINVIFAGNTAGGYGGGMCNEYWNYPTLTNVIFAGNSALTYDGGGIFNYYSNPTLTHVTFSGNSAHRQGGGIGNNETSLPAVRNSILWGNIPDQISNDATVSYSLVQGAAVYTGTGNINSDPLFVDADGVDNVMGTADDDLHLRIHSPACDAGHNDALPADSLDLDDDGDTTEKIPVDLGGRPRFFDNPVVPDTGNGLPPLVDMGAYEAVSSILTLRKSVTPTQAVRYQGTVTYTLIISNAGVLSDSVILTDALPDEVIFGGWVISPTGTLQSKNAITWTGAISAGANVTATFTATHSGDYGDYGEAVTNTAHLSGTWQTGSDDATFTVQDLYTLTVHTRGAGGGSVIRHPTGTLLLPGQSSYPYGTIVTLTATPDAGSAFAGWHGDAAGGSATVTTTMTADRAVTATFDLLTHTLTVHTLGTGSVTRHPTGTLLLPAQSGYLYSTVVTLTAQPTGGAVFDGWRGDLAGLTNPATITMDADKLVTATFVLTNHAPTADVGQDQIAYPGDTVTLDGSGSSDPDAGDVLTYHWAQSGGPAPAGGPWYTITPTFTAPAHTGRYTFTLTVTDTGGLSDSDITVVTVSGGDRKKTYLPLVLRYTP